LLDGNINLLQKHQQFLNLASTITRVRKEFRKLVSMDEAREIIRTIGIEPRIIDVDIVNANGHVLSEDIISEVDVPSFDRASMDGMPFALRIHTQRARIDPLFLNSLVPFLPE